MAFEEDDAVDQLVGVLHFLDGFFTFLLCKAREAPIAQEAVVKPILVDGAQLQKQSFVQALNDFLVPFHGRASFLEIGFCLELF